MFTNFKPKDSYAPTMVFPLPHAGITTCIHGMSLKDENDIKSSIVSNDSESRQFLNSFIYSKCTFPNQDIKDEEEFYSKVSISDRSILYYYLYLLSYGAEYKTTVKCNQCKATIPLDINLNKVINITGKTKDLKDILTYRHVYECDTIEAKFKLKIATIRDEIRYYKLGIPTDDTFIDKRQMLFNITDSIEYIPMDSEEVKVITVEENMLDIWQAINNLNTKEVTSILNEYDKVFTDGYASFEHKFKCPKCKEKINISIDIYQEFFRSVLS